MTHLLPISVSFIGYNPRLWLNFYEIYKWNALKLMQVRYFSFTFILYIENVCLLQSVSNLHSFKCIFYVKIHLQHYIIIKYTKYVESCILVIYFVIPWWPKHWATQHLYQLSYLKVQECYSKLYWPLGMGPYCILNDYWLAPLFSCSWLHSNHWIAFIG